jgi:DNA-binding transcriptional MerR regulator
VTKASEDRWKEWYGENRDEWNKRRRERYAKDPNYRGTVLKRSKEFRETQRESERDERRREQEAVKMRPVDHFKTSVEKVNGKNRAFFTIGKLAKELNVSVQALRLWEKKGVIPAAAKRSAGQNRLYTAEQITLIKKKLAKENRLGFDRRKNRRMNSGERWKVRLDDGKVEERVLFTVGMLATAVSKTPVTLSLLERKGHLPSTSLRGPFEDEDKDSGEGAAGGGRRLYTAEQIQAVVEAYTPRSGLRAPSVWQDFFREVRDKWAAARCLKAEALERITP